MAAQPMLVIALPALTAAWIIRASGGWQPIFEDDATPDPLERLNSGPSAGIGTTAWVGSAAVWAATLALPVGLMLANLRVPRAWGQGLTVFSQQWSDSLQVSAYTGLAAVALAIGSVGLWQASGWRPLRWGGLLGLLAATVPPPAMGIGFVLVFNRGGLIGDVYTQTPLVWVAALVGRYGAVAVLIVWLALGRRSIVAVDQARVDGGGGLDILAYVLLPLLWPSLVAAGLIVIVLSLFEIVVTQMTLPPAYGSIAMTILNYMHYGRDDAVIASSVTLVVAGVLVTQLCAHFIARVTKR
jgi:iron(III) transport system permease protein